MKIVAGLGSIDDYINIVEAGADEVFCGFVPYEWNKKYGSLFPLNRREVLYYNIQINSYEDMKILYRMIQVYKVPVSITFNYIYYLPEQYEMIEDIIKKLIDIGFEDFIIADIALILYLRKQGIKCNIQLSGESAEFNSLAMEVFNKLDISRYIFHRKNTIEDMKSCIDVNKGKNIEYEAFILNERCHYSGAFCNSLHCDELIHLCKMPYSFIKESEGCNSFKEVNDNIERYNTLALEDDLLEEEETKYNFGSTGCGICALKGLKKAGVTHLKVVGRGNSIDNMKRDIENLRRAHNLLEIGTDEKEYLLEVKKKLTKGKCSGECYY